MTTRTLKKSDKEAAPFEKIRETNQKLTDAAAARRAGKKPATEPAPAATENQED